MAADQLVEGVGDEVVLFSVFLALTTALLVYLWLRGSQSGQAGVGPQEQDRINEVDVPSSSEEANTRDEPEQTVEEMPRQGTTGINEEPTVRSRFQRPQADEEEDDYLSIRLILPNTSTLTVNVQHTSTIGDIRRTYFQEQLAEYRAVRFIYQGRVLDDDMETLRHIGVGPRHAIHIHFGRPTPPGSQGNQDIGPQQPGQILDLSKLFLPLFGVILGICWVCMFIFPDIFSLLTKFILFLLSFVFIFIGFVTSQN